MAQPAPRHSIDLSEQFDRYYSKVYKYFRYRGADIDTANDLASTVFERALAKLSSFDPRKAAFNTWLFTIAHNVAINYWKARSRARIVSLETVAPQPGTDPPPDETLILQERIETLLAALRALEEREREIVAFKFSGALNNRQIADLVGLSASNVGVILHRALHRLKVILSETEGQVRDE
ncbi:MAG: sigma-70 family RNA polymerase sigma factor [Anaerolineales bacterium]|nr:sigma-70 family RNA polymerase sigma factor [Anaerolineales bacterium]